MGAALKRRKLLGSILLVLGVTMVITQLITFPGMLFGGCTAVGVQEGQGQGISIIAVQDLNLLYTPDGVNECSIPLPAVLIPFGFIGIGGGLILSTK